MIARDAVPATHTPPLGRIDLSPRYEATPPTNVEIAEATLERINRVKEGDRIWKLLVDVAAGTNPPSRQNGEVQ